MNKQKSLHIISVLCLALLGTSSTLLLSPAQNPFVNVSYNGAGVLPIYVHKEDKFVVLGCERHGVDRGTYDSFAGARDAGEFNPTLTAARECAEELITHRTMRKNVSQLQDYIDVNHKNTELVIVSNRKQYVLFVVNFDQYIDSIKRSFYKTVKKPKISSKYKEKDKLAFVSWNAFEEAIKNNSTAVIARVQEEDPIKCKLTLKKQTIQLRPILVSVMRPYFNNEQYQKGLHPKIRLY